MWVKSIYFEHGCGMGSWGVLFGSRSRCMYSGMSHRLAYPRTYICVAMSQENASQVFILVQARLTFLPLEILFLSVHATLSQISILFRRSACSRCESRMGY